MNEARADVHFERGYALYNEKRFEEAVAEFRAAAELGHARALSSIGFLHSRGGGVAKDPAKAHELFKRAAAMGSVHGMHNLAYTFLEGVREAGVAPNRGEAMRLARQAAEGGHVGAMADLGVWLCEDNKDDPEQIVWLRRAVDEGSKVAMNSLGVCYERGEGGLEKSATTANSWYLKAAELGEPAAMYNLGISFEVGRGVEKNLAKAAEWYERASKAGFDRAPAKLTRIKKLIAAEQALKEQTSSSSSTAVTSSPCSACGEPATDRCSGCLEKFYCSHECQLAQWKEHKVACKAKQAKLKEEKQK